MLKRKISFINFTVIVCGLIIAAGTICLLLMQKNLIKEDTKYLAYTELAQEVKRAKKNIGFDENENPYIKSDFYDLEEKDTYNENVYVFLQSRDGSFLDGRMPDDSRTGLDIGLQSLTKVTFQGERYYVATRRGKRKNGTEDDSFLSGMCYDVGTGGERKLSRTVASVIFGDRSCWRIFYFICPFIKISDRCTNETVE